MSDIKKRLEQLEKRKDKHLLTVVELYPEEHKVYIDTGLLPDSYKGKVAKNIMVICKFFSAEEWEERYDLEAVTITQCLV